MSDTKALQRAPQKTLDRLAFEPEHLDDLSRITAGLHESGLLPDGVRNPLQAMAIAHYGRTLGLDVWQSFRGIDVIKGRPHPSAALVQGLIMSSGCCDYFEPREQSAQRVTWATRRTGGSGNEIVSEYTIAEAERAGLVRGGGNWAKHPLDMLNARCRARLGRLVYPDVVGGMYLADEVSEPRGPQRDNSDGLRQRLDERAEEHRAAPPVERRSTGTEVSCPPVIDVGAGVVLTPWLLDTRTGEERLPPPAHRAKWLAQQMGTLTAAVGTERAAGVWAELGEQPKRQSVVGWEAVVAVVDRALARDGEREQADRDQRYLEAAVEQNPRHTEETLAALPTELELRAKVRGAKLHLMTLLGVEGAKIEWELQVPADDPDTPDGWTERLALIDQVLADAEERQQRAEGEHSDEVVDSLPWDDTAEPPPVDQP